MDKINSLIHTYTITDDFKYLDAARVLAVLVIKYERNMSSYVHSKLLMDMFNLRK